MNFELLEGDPPAPDHSAYENFKQNCAAVQLAENNLLSLKTNGEESELNVR